MHVLDHEPAFEFIDSAEGLSGFFAGFPANGWVAVDTEFYRRDTYFPTLCLVQVYDGRKLGLIDTLAVGRAEPLQAMFADTEIVKVFHAPEQDCEALSRTYGAIPVSIFDTQLAASMLGQPLTSGYGQLVETFLGVKLGKAHTRTDWRQRPLGDSQLRYAAEDVLYLGELYSLFKTKLEQAEKLRWFEAESAERGCGVAELTPEDLAAKINVGPVKHVNPESLQVLAVWRESLAQRLDVPRRWVIDDETLARWSTKLPDKQKLVHMLTGVPEELARDAANDLIERMAAVPGRSVELGRPASAEGEGRLLFDLVRNVVNIRSQAVEINPTLLATRAELEKLIEGRPESPLLRGWRYEVIGRELEELLAGNRAIKYNAATRKLESVLLREPGGD